MSYMIQASRSPAATLLRKPAKTAKTHWLPTGASCLRDENSASNSKSRNLKRVMRPPMQKTGLVVAEGRSPPSSNGWAAGPSCVSSGLSLTFDTHVWRQR